LSCGKLRLAAVKPTTAGKIANVITLQRDDEESVIAPPDNVPGDGMSATLRLFTCPVVTDAIPSASDQLPPEFPEIGPSKNNGTAALPA